MSEPLSKINKGKYGLAPMEVLPNGKKKKKNFSITLGIKEFQEVTLWMVLFV